MKLKDNFCDLTNIKIFMLIFLFFCSFCVYAIEITEIFYDAKGSDNNNEFIEIFFNNNSLWVDGQNLTGYLVGDLVSNDSLNLVKKIPNSSFALIVEEGYNFSNLNLNYIINCTIYSAGSTIGNNLNNDFDRVYLYDLNSTLIVKKEYDSISDFISGTSLNYYQNISFYDLPSPCFLNTRNITNNNLSKINQSNMTINYSYNNTNQNNSNNYGINQLCPNNFSIISQNLFNQTKLIFSFEVDSQSNDYEIEYWVEDFFGDVVKDKIITKNTNVKQYTPKIEMQYFLYRICAELKLKNCSKKYYDSQIVSYISEKKETESVVVQSPDEDNKNIKEKEQNAEIIHIYSSKKINFGDVIELKLNLKNLDSDYELLLYVLDQDAHYLSEKKKLRFFRGSEALMSVKLKLNGQCKKLINATVFLEAFDIIDTKNITINCPRKIIKKSTKDKIDENINSQYNTEKKLFDKNNLSNHDNIIIKNKKKNEDVLTSNIIYRNNKTSNNKEKTSAMIVYMNSSAKARELIPYMLFFSFLLIVLLILWKRF